MTPIPIHARRFQHMLRKYGTDDTPQGCLIDLLADARHWCDRHSEDFAQLDRIAYQHYLAERQNSRRDNP